MKVIQIGFPLTLLFLKISAFEFAWAPGHHGNEEHRRDAKSLINEWTVELEGGEEVAQLVAMELGYEYGGPVKGFSNMYAFHAYKHTMHRRTPGEHTSILLKDRRIRWAEQLYVKSRVKRYPIADYNEELVRVKRQNKTSTERSKRNGVRRQWLFNDELWSYEWYLQDTRTDNNLPRLDLNVLPVYAMGYNGRGVRVSVLDDGVEHNHTDLRANYDSDISWDCNDNDSDPYPKHGENSKNSHGTRCAGEIAMTANNKKCGVGVAWGAKVGGVRMLDGRITDRVEGEGIGYAWDKVDIYSASWGPSDDGKTVEGPGRLAVEAIKRGISRGRNGKGTIYVWANGNGGGNFDNCNCDGYSSSIYTISIGSASQQGRFPWYGEICSSTLATAYSSGAYKDQKIATTDIYDSCTVGHTGTSAAAPLAAGIIALALHANPDLTWRDVQHLIVWTSEYSPLSENNGWQMNGVGLYFDVRFGFGLLNAGALVSSALNWTNVPKQLICRSQFGPTKKEYGYVDTKGPFIFKFELTKCEINYIEHVEIVVNIEYTRRGALEIYLTSPLGTTVSLISARPKDDSKDGFVNWPLTSVAMWGERANGQWMITIKDTTGEQNTGYVNPFTMIVHGTHEMPVHMKRGPRKYNNEYNIHLNVPSEHSSEQNNYIDLRMLNQIGEELLREHHNNALVYVSK